MNTIELKKELHHLIDTSDANFVKTFYKIAKEYLHKTENSKLIEESEIDIKEGNIHSLSEVKEIVKNWK